MQIDRSNYEVWLIDWLDGNLNDIECEQLQHFLTANPDLKNEFDELNIFRLKPSDQHYPDKRNLKRTISNLSIQQLDYLSVAYLENDLTTAQKDEFKSSIETDPEKKRSFELIQKTKLEPVSISYKNRKRLFRRTPVQKLFRLSLIGLSAAAIILLVIMTNISRPRALQVDTEKITRATGADSTKRKSAGDILAVSVTAESKRVKSVNRHKNPVIVAQKTISAMSDTSNKQLIQNDSLVRYADPVAALPGKIFITEKINLNTGIVPGTLVALNSAVSIQDEEDDRSKLRKFIAKTFREKILKEKTAKDSPLKVYEIAEAGVSGLNKLLGWQMALDEKRDGNGVLKSVYFSSRMLKFNAPVKNSEPLK
jgi:hypothetical protein